MDVVKVLSEQFHNFVILPSQVNHQWQYWGTLVFPSVRLTDGGHDGVQGAGYCCVDSVECDGLSRQNTADTYYSALTHSIYTQLSQPFTPNTSIHHLAWCPIHYVKLCIVNTKPGYNKIFNWSWKHLPTPNQIMFVL